MARKRKKEETLEKLQPRPPEKLQPTTDLSNLRLRPTPLVSTGEQKVSARRGRLLNLLGLGSALVAAGSAAAGRLDIASAASGLGQGLLQAQREREQAQAASEERAFQRQTRLEQLRLAQEELALRRAELLRRAQQSEEERALERQQLKQERELAEKELRQRRELAEKELQQRKEIAVLQNAARFWGADQERQAQVQVLSQIASEYLADLSNTLAEIANLQQSGRAIGAQEAMARADAIRRQFLQYIAQLSRIGGADTAIRLMEEYRRVRSVFSQLPTPEQPQQ